MHRRKAIRDHFVAALTGGATGAKVTSGLVFPEQVEALPAFDVSYAGEAPVDPETAGADQSWTVSIEVACRAAGSDYLDTLDAMALEAQQAIGADLKLGGLADHTEPVQTGAVELHEELETPAGAMPLTFDVLYTAPGADPQ